MLSISWKVVACGADISEDPFWNDVRVPAHCEQFDKALDIYLDEYVQALPMPGYWYRHPPRLSLTRES